MTGPSSVSQWGGIEEKRNGKYRSAGCIFIEPVFLLLFKPFPLAAFWNGMTRLHNLFTVFNFHCCLVLVQNRFGCTSGGEILALLHWLAVASSVCRTFWEAVLMFWKESPMRVPRGSMY